MSLAIAFCDCGRADDIRLGEPILVCLGVVALGGGRRGVLRMCSVSSTSGAEPMKCRWLVLLYPMALEICSRLSTYSLATPSHWSSKCLAPASQARRVTRRCQPWVPYHAHHAHPCRSKQFQFCCRAVSMVTRIHICAFTTHRPTLPTSKY
jgi:hypothetical protein